MAQATKFTIDPNLSGIQLRTQASEMLTALSTLNSGDLEPVNPTGGMLWLDTTKNILKIRDKTNTAWLDFASVNDKVVAASTADSLKLGGLAADKYALKDDIPSTATETKAGIVKLKNSITGSLSDTAVSEKAITDFITSNFANSKQETGYIKFPNGLIFQWGRRGYYPMTDSLFKRGAVTYPIAFPNNTLNVTTGCWNDALLESNASESDYRRNIYVTLANRDSRTGFSFLLESSSNPGYGCAFDWLAIGH